MMRPARPRLVATDLDGTLLDSSGRVSPYSRAVLERLWEAGVETLFVTARPPRWIDALADAVGGHGLAICANGAFVYDVAVRSVVRSHVMDLDLVLELLEDLRRKIPGIWFGLEHADGLHVEDPGGLVLTSAAEATTGPFATAGIAGVGKLLARVPGTDPAAPVLGPEGATTVGMAFIENVRRVIGERAVVNYSGARGLAEIGPVGVSKASALADWCSERAIDRAEVWAFGDMPNDIPMLTWAGRSFAVAGAPAEVVTAATDRCGGNDEDGVARALADLLDIADS